MPVAETMRMMMDESELYPLGETNPTWNYHKFIPYYNQAGGSADAPEIVPNQIFAYGIPSTLEQYCLQAQIANFLQYRALIEGSQI